MPVLIEDIAAALIWLILVIFTMAAGIVLVTIQRRITRQRYFQRLDRERHLSQEWVEPLYQNQGDLDLSLASVHSFRSTVTRRALEETLLHHARHPDRLDLSREILQQLGWIRGWVDVVRSSARRPKGAAARVLTEFGDNYRPPGRIRRIQLRLKANFMARCLAVDKLAQVPTPEGIQALIAGTADRNEEVQQICVRHLGQLADPATLPLLVEILMEVIEGKRHLSVRNVKAALVRFPLEEIEVFRPALGHLNPRVRFFATDIIREITERHAATDLLSKIYGFLRKCRPQSAGVPRFGEVFNYIEPLRKLGGLKHNRRAEESGLEARVLIKLAQKGVAVRRRGIRTKTAAARCQLSRKKSRNRLPREGRI